MNLNHTEYIPEIVNTSYKLAVHKMLLVEDTIMCLVNQHPASKAMFVFLVNKDNKPCLKSRFVCGILPSEVYSRPCRVDPNP